ncbi:uncharacterized protein LOC110861693 [Folsomia candida]|uniref:Uncharacterized protein n=1 Tax=Folsomia candida TaxID=158441 RepID=A0A226CZ86_FOLCA|nr:uncharacterized protein LOC110861693 [Folsomia candida]OXA38622.1 hypothetical protein Fcan01_26552 [Folsomia candida]
MTSLKFSVVLIFAISIVSTAPPPERKCRTVWTDLNKLELRQIGVCTKELGWKGGREKTQKSTCTMKCVLTKEGLIQEDGHLSITNYNSYLLDHFPPSLVERSNETFFPCFELFEGTNIGVDPDCKEYEPFTKCLTKRFADLCKGLP